MPASDVSETANALRLAYARWGPTGFACPHCGHDRAYHLAPPRERTFQCVRCRRQKSVTAGTAMHGTKVDIRVWMARGEWLETGDVPTSYAFAIEHGIASSSAWHLNQRFMAALDLGQPKPLHFAGYLVLEQIRCRRPKRISAVPDDTPPVVREKCDRFLEQRKPLLHEVALGVGGREVVVVDACPTEPDVARMRSRPFDLVIQIQNRGIERWLESYLDRHFRTVCVRWMSAYLRHLLQVWNRMRLGVARRAEWVGAVLAGPRRGLRSLRAGPDP